MITKEVTNPLDMVVEFMTTAEQTVRTVPTYVIPEEALRFELIREEIRELLIDGFKANNFIEVIDACADIVYVVCGAAATYGVGSVESGQALTMRIIRPTATRKTSFDAENDFADLRNDLVFDLVSYLDVLRDIKAVGILRDMQFNDFDSHAQQVAEFSKHLGSEDDKEFGKRLVEIWENMVALCYNIASAYGVNLDLVLDEVQASNMSKFGPNLEVYRREDGKIMKGPNYFKPDIAKVLSDQGVVFAESK